MRKLLGLHYRVAAPAVGLVVAGCATGGTVGEGASSRNPNLLTREEIAASDATNLYDAIARLRPRWLQIRSQRSFSMPTEIAVLQNELYLGNAEVLKQMTLDAAYRIEYYEGARAATAFPALMTGRHIEGAIVVRTREGREGGGG